MSLLGLKGKSEGIWDTCLPGKRIAITTTNSSPATKHTHLFFALQLLDDSCRSLSKISPHLSFTFDYLTKPVHYLPITRPHTSNYPHSLDADFATNTSLILFPSFKINIFHGEIRKREKEREMEREKGEANASSPPTRLFTYSFIPSLQI